MNKRKWGKRLLIAAAAFLLIFGIYLSSVVIGAAAISEKQLTMNETTTIVDDSGEQLAELYSEDREVIEEEQIPDHVKEAFISIEDIRFYDHRGIDPRAIARALYRDILAGGIVEGGSTITQQLAKNAFLSSDQTFLRKTKEVLIAMGLEKKFSKDEVMGYYLNQIYFGHGAYGIQSASQQYFGKDASDLNVEEGAMLAAMVKGPSNYSPVDEPEEAKERRDTVIAIMEREGYISEEEKATAASASLPSGLQEQQTHPEYYTYVDMLMKEAQEKYSIEPEEIYKGGYTIQVPMNEEMQQASYSLMQEEAYYPDGSEDAESAFFMMNHNTGGVVAVQGGRDYERQGMNRAEVKRQPGSAFKPLAVYGPALESGDYEPYSTLKDEQLDYDGYSPKNNSGEYQGEVTMSEALEQSINTSAVWLYDKLERSSTNDFLEKTGIEPQGDGLATALGGLENGVTPAQLTEAYTTFSNNGTKTEPYFITNIKDRNGNIIVEHETKEQEVMDPQNAWYMTRMLENVVENGTASAGNTSYDLAGKTGTTSFEAVEGGARDAWFAGYTPQWTGTLWMGYDQTTEDNYLTGGSSHAVELFKSILNETPAGSSAVEFEKPEGVRDLEEPVELPEIDSLEGDLTFAGDGFLNVELTWEASEDDRVNYTIYEVTDGEREEIDQVRGQGSYTIQNANPFNLREYIVVPSYEPTNQEGEDSNTAEVQARSIFGLGG